MNRGRMELSVFGGICWGMETNELSWLWGGHSQVLQPFLGPQDTCHPKQCFAEAFWEVMSGQDLTFVCMCHGMCKEIRTGLSVQGFTPRG